jgi:hypothetical protein
MFSRPETSLKISKKQGFHLQQKQLDPHFETFNVLREQSQRYRTNRSSKKSLQSFKATETPYLEPAITKSKSRKSSVGLAASAEDFHSAED